ncbi:MAG: FadR/GntR family transcriptional regulator [Bryobacteraceae bacterium]
MRSRSAGRPKIAYPQDDLTNRLIARFRDLVADGSFRPGAKLPPERTLAERFGVNRTSLRHALSALEIMGIVTRRVGDGTYLSVDSRLMLSAPMDFLVLVEGISFQDLMEARIIIEPALAWRAAMRADSQQIEAVRKAVVRMDESGGKVHLLVEADVAFHEAVAAASGNVTCQRMFAAIHHTLLRLIKHNAQSEEYRRKAARHRQIYTAIRRREAELAAERMRSHLKDALAMFVRLSREQADRARKAALRKKLMPIGSAN